MNVCAILYKNCIAYLVRWHVADECNYCKGNCSTKNGLHFEKVLLFDYFLSSFCKEKIYYSFIISTLVFKDTKCSVNIEKYYIFKESNHLQEM